MEILAYILIAILLGVEVWCGYSLRQIIRCRSEERTEQRREAFRPASYKKVHDEWTVLRNRRSLWDNINK